MTDHPQNPHQLLEQGQLAYQNRDYSSAQKYLQMAADEFSQLGNERGHAAALTNLGASYGAAKMFSASIETLERAVDLHFANRELEGYAMSTFSLATVLLECGQLFRARNQFEKGNSFLVRAGLSEFAQQGAEYIRMLNETLPQGISEEEQEKQDQLNSQLTTASDAAMVSYRTGNLQAAIEYWQLALQASQALSRSSRSAELMLNLGTVRCRQGFLNDGAQVFEEVQHLAQDCSARAIEATALNNLGSARFDMGDMKSARDSFRGAVKLRRLLPDLGAVAESVTNLAITELREGRTTAALEGLSEAYEIYTGLRNSNACNIIRAFESRVKCGDALLEVKFFGDSKEDQILGPEEINNAFAKGQEAIEQADFEGAATAYRNVLSSARFIGDRRLQATALIAMGFNERRRGRLTESILCYQQALSLARQSGDLTLQSRALNNLGVLYGDDTETALSFLEEASRIRAELPNQHELGETYLSMGNILPGDDGTRYLELALPLLDPTQNLSAWAATYEELKSRLPEDERRALVQRFGEIATSVGIEDLPKAINDKSTLFDTVSMDDSGSWGLVIRVPEQRHRDADHLWSVLNQKASTLWEMGKSDEAVATLREALELVERNRERIQSDTQRKEYGSRVWSVYDSLISKLVKLNQIENALEIVERTKTRTLASFLHDVEYISPEVPTPIRREYLSSKVALQQRSAEYDRLSREAWKGETDTLSSMTGDLVRAYARADEALKDVRRYAPGTTPESPLPTLDFKTIQMLLLSDNHAFLIYWLGRTVTGVFIMTRSFIRFIDLGGAMSFDFSNFLSILDGLPLTKSELDQQLGSAYESLIAPVLDSLNQSAINELTIIPHYYTHAIPFHALRAKSAFGIECKFLMDDFSVNYAPSFAVYKRSLQIQISAGQADSILIVGDPDGTLPFARVEADRIHEIYTHSDLLSGASATADAVSSSASNFTHLHFACHAYFGADEGSEIGLKLAPGLNHDGLFSLRQIASKLVLVTGSVVVLSGCRTGRAVLERSDEYLGLAGGFLLAGANAVIGSLWPVEDVSTALLMQDFYGRLLAGTRHTEALRQSQIWLRNLSSLEAANMIKELRAEDLPVIPFLAVSNDMPFSHPYFWAGFFDVGGSGASLPPSDEGSRSSQGCEKLN